MLSLNLSAEAFKSYSPNAFSGSSTPSNASADIGLPLGSGDPGSSGEATADVLLLSSGSSSPRFCPVSSLYFDASPADDNDSVSVKKSRPSEPPVTRIDPSYVDSPLRVSPPVPKRVRAGPDASLYSS